MLIIDVVQKRRSLPSSYLILVLEGCILQFEEKHDLLERVHAIKKERTSGMFGYKRVSTQIDSVLCNLNGLYHCLLL